MADIAYADFLGPVGQFENMGGTTQRVFFASIGDFLAIQKPVANPTTFAAKSEIATAHTFKPTKCFKKMYCTMDKGQVEAKSQGDMDGKSLKQEGTVFYPGSSADLHGFMGAAKNDSFIFLFETPDTAQTGEYIQVGTEEFPAKFTGEFSTATNSSGVRGYNCKIEAMTPIQYIYKAAVTVVPA
jgi:hypothetical protein